MYNTLALLLPQSASFWAPLLSVQMTHGEVAQCRLWTTQSCLIVRPPTPNRHPRRDAWHPRAVPRYPSTITPCSYLLPRCADEQVCARRSAEAVGPSCGPAPGFGVGCKGRGGGRWIRTGCWSNAEVRAYVCTCTGGARGIMGAGAAVGMRKGIGVGRESSWRGKWESGGRDTAARRAVSGDKDKGDADGKEKEGEHACAIRTRERAVVPPLAPMEPIHLRCVLYGEERRVDIYIKADNAPHLHVCPEKIFFQFGL
ncbi:hypothetical protein B0H19DRAFT_1086227 [Mycena capillaripes]|nr:hypothetical protein B0H19DRAFT_1086227 [Mycena capillaripes]